MIGAGQGNRRVWFSAWFGVTALALVLSGAASASSRAVKAFPWSKEIFHQSISADDYRVYLSAVKQIDGELRADRSVRLAVTGEAVGTLVHDGYGPVRVMDFYRSQLKALGARILYTCDGLDCGPSSLWANRVFGQAGLFAPDEHQHYLVAQWAGPDQGKQLGLFYVVRRGDQEVRGLRILLQLKAGESLGVASDSGKRVLGPVIIPWEPGIAIRLETDARSIRRVQALADRYPGAEFVISSFTALGDGTFRQRMQLAERAGKVAARQLQHWGVQEKRITVLPVGPGIVIDAPNRTGNRVEIVVVRKRGNAQ